MSMKTAASVQQAAISIQVTRADGTVEDLGIVAYTSRNPLQRAKYALLKRLGRRVDETAFFGPDSSLLGT